MSDLESLMRGESSAFVRALGFISDGPEDSLDLGPDDRYIETDDGPAPELAPVFCEQCQEEEIEGVCMCRCRGCGQPDKSGWCDDCDDSEEQE